MVRRILISLLVNVGDVIMMTSALDLIRRHYSGRCHIAVLVRPEAVELLDGSPAVDEILVYPYKSGSLFHGLGRLRRRMKSGGYDLFISLDRRPRGAAAAFVSGIKERIGPDILFSGARPKLWTKLLFTKTVSMSPEECAGSLVEMFQLVVRRGLGAEGRGRISLPPVTAERDRRAAAMLGETGERPVIGLCVRTNDPGKTWSAGGFIRLMNRLGQETGAFMYVTGGPGDREYVETLLESVAPPVVNLAGRTSLMDIPALAARSSLCVTLDNGAAHLMANSGLERLVCILLATRPAILIDSMPRAEFISFPPGGHDEARIDEQADLVFQTVAGLLKGTSKNQQFLDIP